MKQLHDRAFVKPICVKEMTQVERRWATESLIFLVEKQDRRIKACTCANGSTQCGYTKRDKAASPTAMTELILITAMINAKQKWDVMTANIPMPLFKQTLMTRTISKDSKSLWRFEDPSLTC
jgi:hypothetical protein